MSQTKHADPLRKRSRWKQDAEFMDSEEKKVSTDLDLFPPSDEISQKSVLRPSRKNPISQRSPQAQHMPTVLTVLLRQAFASTLRLVVPFPSRPASGAFLNKVHLN